MGASTVLGVRVDRVDYDEALERIFEAAKARRAFRVACANVHVIMEAGDDPELAAALDAFELVVADGQPVRWVLNHRAAEPLPERVYGPELMRRACVLAARRDTPVYLFGSSPEVISALPPALRRIAPGLSVAGAESPPFGAALWNDVDAAVARIRSSGAELVFVGLGCPKQERWLARHGEQLGMPSLAVGAAFDLLAGAKPMAPAWMQRVGLEWAFRLSTEPRRTFRRYVMHNPRFAWKAAREALARRQR